MKHGSALKRVGSSAPRALVLILCTLALARNGHAQSGGLAPITTPADRLMLFDHGRFHEVDQRGPSQVMVVGDRLLFVDHAGALHSWQDGQLELLDPGPGITIERSRNLVLWRQSRVLKGNGPRGPITLSTAVGEITATDSLVAFHDEQDAEMRVWWRGRLLDVATMDSAAGRATWSVGSNMVLFHDRGRRRVSMVHHGLVQPLYDSTDMALVAAGGDLAAYWDDGPGVFRVWDRGRTQDLEPFRPRSFHAGDGVVAYVSNGGAFKVYRDGSVHTLLDHPPSEHWVQDSLVLFVDGGRFLVERAGQAEVVERYVPEHWRVEQGTLTYLDLDRGIRQWSHGVRTVLAEGFAARRFEVWGDVVVWRTEDGAMRCWWRGRRYEL